MIPVQFNPADFVAPGQTPVLRITSRPTDPTNRFEPGAVRAFAKGGGPLDFRSYYATGTGGASSVSVVVARPGPISLVVAGKNNSFGAFQLDVALAGDVNSDGRVSPTDLQTIVNDFGALRGRPGYLAAADLNGDGTFQKPYRYDAPNNTAAIVADLNRDGRLDITGG